MKIKKDCNECGKPLADWQIKQGYTQCLDCYNAPKAKKKPLHEELEEIAVEEESEKNVNDESETDTETEKEVDEGVKEIASEDLGYGSGHLEDEDQGEEEDE
jgi:ssDNA-binding Zn-finger/Zn-ribbon topoisomerase 1